MKSLFPLCGALLTAAFAPASADAAVIGTYSYDYSIAGNRDGQGFAQDATGVRITDTATPFVDRFDFSNLAGRTIDSFTLSFAVTGASERFAIGGFLGLDLLLQERWTVSTGGVNAADLPLGILDDVAPEGRFFTLNGATGQAFDDALANLQLGFSFEADGLALDNAFTLSSATLTVNGAVVPLPAPGFLLLAALGGLTVLRRKGAPDKSAA